MAEIQLKEINEMTLRDAPGMIRESDSLYRRSICSIADALEKRGANIVLLAGPSSSGKTTTAGIIRDHLSEIGHETIVVSLDDFYRDRDDPAYPLDETGRQDYESVEALHTDKIQDFIAKLLCGREVYMPRYVFEKGESYQSNEPIRLREGSFVIMEGLHALNPIIIDGIDRSRIVKMFISVSTNINDGNERILSGRKIRFIRRMTRDSIYRGTSAASTLERWKSVLDGEDKYLYPFKESADIKLDTFHKYELGIMRPFAEAALRASESELCGEYINIIRKALGMVIPADIALLPEKSLISEFVPKQ